MKLRNLFALSLFCFLFSSTFMIGQKCNKSAKSCDKSKKSCTKTDEASKKSGLTYGVEFFTGVNKPIDTENARSSANFNNTKCAFSAGLTLGYNLSNKIAVLSGLTYANKGYTEPAYFAFENELSSSTTLGNNIEMQDKYSFHYLEVPVNVKFTPCSKSCSKLGSMYLLAGISNYFNLESNVSTQEKASIGNRNPGLKKSIDGFNAYDLGFNLGFGIEKNLCEQMSMYFEPKVQIMPFDITNNISDGRILTSFGLAMGVRL